MSPETDRGKPDDFDGVATPEKEEDKLKVHKFCQKIFLDLNAIQNPFIKSEIGEMAAKINRMMLQIYPEKSEVSPDENQKLEAQALCRDMVDKTRETIRKEDDPECRANLFSILRYTTGTLLPFVAGTVASIDIPRPVEAKASVRKPEKKPVKAKVFLPKPEKEEERLRIGDPRRKEAIRAIIEIAQSKIRARPLEERPKGTHIVPGARKRKKPNQE